MPCYKPLKGYRAPSGKITFDRKASTGKLAEAPCGQCLGCRLDYAQEWAIRCLHESELYDDNCFITLTYAPEHLPMHGSLDKTHFQDFMKRLRDAVAPLLIRFYHCGEYGDKLSRPHYHALIFNFNFPDKYLWTYGQGKNPLYRSKLLEAKWPYGHSSIGAMTKESAAYCARYTIKKIKGQELLKRDPETDLLPYQTIDPQTGQILDLQPEYATMSRNPGIGRDWYEQFKTDVFPSDYVIHKGRRVRTPQYYRRLLEQSDPILSGQLADKRKAKALLKTHDQSYERLNVREKCKQAQLNNLIRPLHGT